MLDIFKVLDLSDLGEGWEGCEIKFRSLTVSEVEKLSNIDANTNPSDATKTVLELLKSKFVSGTGVRDGSKVELEVKDLDELPVEVLMSAMALFTEGIDKKKLKTSTTASEL